MTELERYVNENLPKLINFGMKVVLALVFFFIGSKVISWMRKLMKRSFERAGANPGVAQFVDSLLKFGLYAVLLFSIATKFGVESSSVAALIASAGVAIGLALQGSLSNLAGGVLILLTRPFVVGDYIIEDTHKNEGTVKEIQIFYTKLSTTDNKTIVIPNGTLANNSLTNVTEKDRRRIEFTIDISYQADLKMAKRLIENLLHEEEAILEDEEILVFVDSLAESAVVLGVRAWVRMEEYWPTRWKLMEQVKLLMDEHGIEIPYQQVTVHVKEAEK